MSSDSDSASYVVGTRVNNEENKELQKELCMGTV